jgi:hypothetical protein
VGRVNFKNHGSPPPIRVSELSTRSLASDGGGRLVSRWRSCSCACRRLVLLLATSVVKFTFDGSLSRWCSSLDRLQRFASAVVAPVRDGLSGVASPCMSECPDFPLCTTPPSGCRTSGVQYPQVPFCAPSRSISIAAPQFERCVSTTAVASAVPIIRRTACLNSSAEFGYHSRKVSSVSQRSSPFARPGGRFAVSSAQPSPMPPTMRHRLANSAASLVRRFDRKKT